MATGIKTVPGLLALALTLIVFGAFSGASWWQRVPERQSLSAARGAFVGIETRSSRYSTTKFLRMNAGGKDTLLLVQGCETDLNVLGAGDIEVLFADNRLFEVKQGGRVFCSYDASSQALSRQISRNNAISAAALSVAVFLLASAVWSRWRTQRHLSKLATSHRAVVDQQQGPR